MPRLHYLADPPNITCPAEGWVLRPATAEMIDGSEPFVCPSCGWTFVPDNLTSPSQAISGPGTADIGAGVVVSVPFYTITASAGAHGSISPSGASDHNLTDLVVYTITPDEGYALDSILIDGVDHTSSAIAGSGHWTYNFSAWLPLTDHTIAASFVVATSDWTIAASHGLEGGPGTGTISPSGSVPVTNGADQVFTFTADETFQVLSVRVDGTQHDMNWVVDHWEMIPSDAGFGTITDAANMTYTFTNVTANHTINVEFDSA